MKNVLGKWAILLLLLSISTVIQAGRSWFVTVYDMDTANISLITPDGIVKVRQVPELLQFERVTDLVESPDGRYLVAEGYKYTEDGWQKWDILVIDLVSNSCCVSLFDAQNPQLDVRWLGPFSPDGTQIAVSLGATISDPQTGINPEIAVFDLATGTMVSVVPITVLNEDYAAATIFGEWDERGIRIAGTCVACEGRFQGLFNIWNPLTNTVTQPVEPFNLFNEDVAGSGEILLVSNNANYPESGAFSPFFPFANVVEYLPSRTSPVQVVYFNPGNLVILDAHWVMNGNAFLVQHGGPLVQSSPDNGGFVFSEGEGMSVLVLPDGQQVSVPNDDFFANVPDGWLTKNTVTNVVTYHIFENGTLQSQVLGTIGEHIIIDSPSVNIINQTFPTMNPPVVQTCPGFLQSRLAPNSVARVTPGDPNNIRAEPNTNSPVLGTIPGEAMFVVVSGPVCADNTAWWQVNHQGTIGWTVEGGNNQYWLEPWSDF